MSGFLLGVALRGAGLVPPTEAAAPTPAPPPAPAEPSAPETMSADGELVVAGETPSTIPPAALGTSHGEALGPEPHVRSVERRRELIAPEQGPPRVRAVESGGNGAAAQLESGSVPHRIPEARLEPRAPEEPPRTSVPIEFPGDVSAPAPALPAPRARSTPEEPWVAAGARHERSPSPRADRHVRVAAQPPAVRPASDPAAPDHTAHRLPPVTEPRRERPETRPRTAGPAVPEEDPKARPRMLAKESLQVAPVSAIPAPAPRLAVRSPALAATPEPQRPGPGIGRQTRTPLPQPAALPQSVTPPAALSLTPRPLAPPPASLARSTPGRQPVLVKVGTVEVRFNAPPAQPEPPSCEQAAPPADFDAYTRLRSYAAWAR